MANIIEAQNANEVGHEILNDMLTLGLAGLGVQSEEIASLIQRSKA